MIFSYKNETFEPRITLRPNGSNSESGDTNFITRESQASGKKASMDIKSLTNNFSNTWPLPHHIAKTLSFYIDASFDQSKRKWFWSNGIEIQDDHWDYQCYTHPHQPATEFAVTISDKGTLLDQMTFWYIYINKKYSVLSFVKLAYKKFLKFLDIASI